MNTTLWNRTIGTTQRGRNVGRTAGLSRPTVRKFVRECREAGLTITVTQTGDFDGRYDGMVDVRQTLTWAQLDVVLNDKSIGAYIFSSVAQCASISLYNAVARYTISCIEAEQAWKVERARRDALTQDLPRFGDADQQRAYHASFFGNLNETRRGYVTANANDGDGISADERAEQVRSWPTDPLGFLERFRAHDGMSKVLG